MPPTELAQAGHSAAVDTMRAIAAGMVVFYHMEQCGFGSMPGAFVVLGALGVNLFFTLSGFLIARSVLQPRSFETRRFLRNRALRILPNYFICALLMVFVVEPRTLAHASPGQLMLDLVTHATLMHGWFASVSTSVIGPLWTLSHEGIFYLLMALFALPLRSKRGWVMPVLMLTTSVVACGLLANGVWHPSTGRLNPICLWSQFAIGIMGAQVSLKVPGWKHPATLMWLLLIGGSLLLGWCIYKQAAFGQMLAMDDAQHHKARSAKEFAMHFSSMFYKRNSNLLWFPLLFAVGTSLTLTALTSGFGRLNTLLLKTPLPALGLISYSTYLYHMAVILCLMRGLKSVPPGGLFESPTAAVIVALVGVYSISLLAYRLFEKPWLDRKAAALPSPAPDSVCLGNTQQAHGVDHE